MKKALVMSGGGSKGAWQVGVLNRLLLEEKNEYEIITGVSVGALNGAFLAQYQIGQEQDAWKNLQRIWSAVEPKKIRKHWFPFGWGNALWQTGLYNSKPLWKLVKNNVDINLLQTSGRELRVGSVNLYTGQYELSSQSDLDITEKIMASSAYPMFFKAVEVNWSLYTDGGIRHITPLKTAIDLGAEHIDVLVTETEDVRPWTEEKPNALDVALRSIEIMNDQNIRSDLKIAGLINKMVKSGTADPKHRAVTVRLFEPSQRLGDGLDFDQKLVQKRMWQGLSDSQNFKVWW